LQTITVLYIISALLLSVLIAYFQYLYKNTDTSKINILLFAFRSLSLFLLGVLLINPTFQKQEIENIKPILSVLIDNSQSARYFQQEKNIEQTLQKIKKSKRINEKFDVRLFSFGNSLNTLDSLSFDKNHTNISDALNSVNELYKNDLGAILMLTDGNQTIGNDYEFTNSKQSVFPLVIGDTTQYKDLKINQLNVNKYSYLKNKFPVEALLQYEGKEDITTKFLIYHKEKKIFSKNVRFSPNKKSHTILANLQATSQGQNYFTASIRNLSDEKNTENNTKNFSIEVLDQQTKVLILSSVLHPDLGALKKAIESNEQRTAEIKMIDNFKGQINDYQMTVLYQPTNRFAKIITALKNQNSNYFSISGIKTDWNFINKQELGFTKQAINQTENYAAQYNASFLTFLQKDIGFNQFSPLKDNYGEVVITKPHQTILYQNINGIQTDQPLLSTFEQNNQKSAVLFGEGIWKWRASSFLNGNSFEDFDEFIGNIVQYLATNKKRNRLEVELESLYASNSIINISAFYSDKNFQFDNRASLELQITNMETKEVKKFPFSLVNTSYQVEVENLIPGDYSYKVSVDGQNIDRDGKFKIIDFKIEEQFTNANYQKLATLANTTGGKLYFPDKIEDALEDLMNNRSFFTTQKSTLKEQHLIDWKWILFFIIGLLSVEWVIRKYYGKI